MIVVVTPLVVLELDVTAVTLLDAAAMVGAVTLPLVLVTMVLVRLPVAL